MPKSNASLKPNLLLQQARKERGWTQEQLAEMIGADPDSIGNWESGRRGTSRFYQKRLESVFGLSTEQLGFSLQSKEPSGSSISDRLSSGQQEEPLFKGPENVLTQEEAPLETKAFIITRNVDENRRHLLQQMRITWIEGVREHILNPGGFIPLCFREEPEALFNPWHLIVRETIEAAHLLPENTSILQLYESANEELLILGDPGMGKSTLLLELARELLIQAEQNEEHALPIIFNLTSWKSKRLSLNEWFLGEMQAKYHIPREVSQAWIENDQIILLLDGLDEVSKEYLPFCMKAIQSYQHTRPHISLVICCRREDYFAQDIRFNLQKAIVIQPLSKKQINHYFTHVTHQAKQNWEVFQNDLELEEICATPLFLNITARTCQADAKAISASGPSLDARRERVFQVYIERMLARRGIENRYNQQQTIRWLSRLAEHMQKNNQSEFYVERIQPTWLSDRMQYHFWRTSIRVVHGIECLIIAGLFALVPAGLFKDVTSMDPGYFNQLGSEPGREVLAWMAPGLGGGSACLGIILALVTVLVSLTINSPFSHFSLQTVWRSVVKAVRSGGIVGGVVGVFVMFLSLPQLDLQTGLARGMDIGLFSGLLVGFQSGLINGLRSAKTAYQSREKPQQTPHFTLPGSKRLCTCLFDFLAFSCCTAIGYGSIYFFIVKKITPDIVDYSIITALCIGILFSCRNAIAPFWEIDTPIQLAEIAKWSWVAARQGLKTTLQKGGTLGLLTAVCIFVTFGAASSLFYGISYGVRFGCASGIIVGLSGTVAVVLAGVLNSGWKTTIIPDDEICQPNEGTHRSLRNAVFAFCVFGSIGGLVSGLVSGLTFAYIGGFPRSFFLVMTFILVLSAIFALHFALAYGLRAWIQHYLLRWYLWRSGKLPAKCVSFFEYACERIFMIKIGGGYMFAHKLLLDYFASLRTVEPDNADSKKLLCKKRET